jgi:acyl-CoA thioesterase-1
MQSSIFLALTLSLLSCLFSTNAVARGSTILVVGDSLSAAHNISTVQSWPVLLQQRLRKHNGGHEVINASISGETSGGGRERLPALLEKNHPDILILELGGNDGLRGYKFSDTRKNLAAMIELALAQKIRVLLIGVRLPPNLGALYNRRFQKIFESLASEFSITYLPQFLQGVAADRPEYMQADGIHPTALAQPLLADRVMQIIRPLLR